jgi:S1-C subfamily serine protease
MSTEANPVSRIAAAIEAQVAGAHGLVAAVRNASHRHISAMVWQGAVVTSEQAVGDRDEYEVVTASGATARARIAGRDPGTNVLVLKPETSLDALATRQLWMEHRLRAWG